MQRFPSYHQHDAVDCGPTCLQMILKHYGRHRTLVQLRDACHIDRDGVSLQDIADAAEAEGLRCTGVAATLSQLVSEASKPCIAHWKGNHFIVVYDCVKRRGKTIIKVSDPAVGLVDYDEKDFARGWLSEDGTGVIMMLEPTPDFYKKNNALSEDDISEQTKKNGLWHMLDYLRPYKNYIIQIVVCMITASLISLVFPFISQSVVDKGIGTGSKHLVIVLLVAQLFLTIGQVANNIIQGWLSLHMTTRVGICLISDYIAKLMRLPIGFFDSKRIGDIIQRIGDHSRIQTFLTGYLLSMVVAVISLVIYSFVMSVYNKRILVVFLLGSFLYIIWSVVFLSRRRKLDALRFQEASANQGSIIQIIQGMTDIKLNGCARHRRWEWEEIQARLYKVSTKQLSLRQAQESGAACIDQVKNIIISFMAAIAVISGEMTLGMMTALQFIIGQLNAPVSQFIAFIQAAQDASISMERLGEVRNLKEEEPLGGDLTSEIPANADIQFKNVSFRYGGSGSPKALDDVTLTIPSGKVTAIVGASGSGKTTMIKLMLGFYQPQEGVITYGGIPVQNCAPSALRARCGSVMQESYIFNGSIAMNIAPAEEKPDLKKVRQCAEAMHILTWIESLPIGFNTRIGSDGNGLSSGQKQRILLSRAIYRDSEFLFLDEATNALDANNEKAVMDNLKKAFVGKTVVIVAHRLSTVRNADNIIVMEDGKIIEEGNHENLTALKGHYYNLVKNQLELGS